ncbi:MAG: beta-lactamase family protein, partial [Gammaproteobacteria bacterium]|nr:beta-lactamase family protein [Gammaproteobacteria bacterium]
MCRPGRLLFALVAGLLTGGMAGGQSNSGTFDEAWASVTAQFDADLRRNRYVGGSLYFTREGQVTGAHHYGHQTLEPRRAVDENTIYHWASITKTFTAIGIMQLRDRGLLDLDHAVTAYIPVFDQAHNPFGDMSDVTIRHLMTHTSGLRVPTFPWGGTEEWHPHEPADWSQWDAMLPYTKLHFAPGSSYSYSNPGPSRRGRSSEPNTGVDREVGSDENRS